jgi:hypothetical protein
MAEGPACIPSLSVVGNMCCGRSARWVLERIGWKGRTYSRHQHFSHVLIGVCPRGAMLNHFICTSRFYLGDHEGFCGGGDYDCAWQAQSARCMDSREAGVAARGAEDVRDGGYIGTEVFEAAEDVVADSSVAS